MQSFDENHSMIIYPLLRLAHIYLDTGKPDEAEPFLRRSLVIQLESSGKDHWMVGVIKNRLGRCFTAMDQFEEAEPFLLKGHEILSEQLGDNHNRTHTAIENLVSLYDSWEKPGKADEFKKLLAKDS